MWCSGEINGLSRFPGHKGKVGKTTVVYTCVLNQGPKGVRSPMDEVSGESYTDHYKTPPVRSENTPNVIG